MAEMRSDRLAFFQSLGAGMEFLRPNIPPIENAWSPDRLMP